VLILLLPHASLATDLICHMICYDARYRITPEKALEHPWIKDQEAVSDTHMETQQAELKKFNAKRKFLGAVKGRTDFPPLTRPHAQRELGVFSFVAHRVFFWSCVYRSHCFHTMLGVIASNRMGVLVRDIRQKEEDTMNKISKFSR
jgi:serine/threonine protein kinase